MIGHVRTFYESGNCRSEGYLAGHSFPVIVLIQGDCYSSQVLPVKGHKARDLIKLYEATFARHGMGLTMESMKERTESDPWISDVS